MRMLCNPARSPLRASNRLPGGTFSSSNVVTESIWTRRAIQIPNFIITTGNQYLRQGGGSQDWLPHSASQCLMMTVQARVRLERLRNPLGRVSILGSEIEAVHSPAQPLIAPRDLAGMEDTGFLTCMTLVLLGNYAQTGHFGGPLAYTPYNVACHLAGPELGGLRYDYRRPKHPYSDKFLMAAGHSVPTCYALWMILGQALERRYKATGDRRYYADPHVAMLPVDALGFRRGAGALATLLEDAGLADHPLFAQAKLRGIRALSGHSEATDLTNDVNGGPSGIGIASAAGKAAFWDFAGAASLRSPKVIALEGEFALTEGHAQEFKTQALAVQAGKRLRVLLSDNNAGIDDSLLGGVIASKYDQYRLIDQWTSYGWNVLPVERGNHYPDILAAFKTMEDWDPADRRPMVVIGKTPT